MISKQDAFQGFQAKLRTILPEDYQDYDEVQPVSMGSAGLKYGKDGKVAWNAIWGSFCDLAMAGGPPHKGALLEPGSLAEIEAHSERYTEVVREICRGIKMVTDLPANPSRFPGWVRVDCDSETMAEWLARAIAMENVSVRCDGATIDLPAGRNYRIEKEIKNVITAIAKTSHYWLGHMWSSQQKEIAKLFAQMRESSALVQPAVEGRDCVAEAHESLSIAIAAAIQRATGLPGSGHRYVGWLGVELPTEKAAIWLMRALVVSNVVSRREGTVLFLPINPRIDPDGEVVIRAVLQMHAFAVTQKVL